MNPSPIPGAPSEAESIEKVRSGHRFILIAILIYILLFAVTYLVPKTDGATAIFGIVALFAMLTAVVLAITGVVRLSTGLGYGIVTRILIIISMFIPIISLIVLAILSGKATVILRAAGYKVGLIGAAARTSPPQG